MRHFRIGPVFGPGPRFAEGPAHPFLALLIVLVVVAAVIAVVYVAFRSHGHRHLPAGPTSTHGPGPARAPSSSHAEEILRERLARGEIGEDEYRRTVALLRENP